MATAFERVEAITADAPSPESEPDPVLDWYDRSSLTGDFMVMIADQTPEDFERRAPESRICEYFDGIVYMPSPATDRHQEIVGFVYSLLDGLHWERGTGRVLTGPAVLRLRDEWKPEPDIFVRPPGDREEGTGRAVLVVEIISRSTRSHDLKLKLPIFREAAIPEIWTIDPARRSIIAEQRIESAYRRIEIGEGRLASNSLPGFWLDVSWLWSDPLPNPRRCLESILSGSHS
jgi:Uma2 family endonuclease